MIIVFDYFTQIKKTKILMIILLNINNFNNPK